MLGNVDHHDLRGKVYKELNDARTSRMQANEGRARVCARRAAGWAIEGLYDAGEAEPLAEANAYRYLQWFAGQEQFPENLRNAANRLTTKVDEDFNLPFEEDPLEDAELIVGWVFAQDDTPDSS